MLPYASLESWCHSILDYGSIFCVVAFSICLIIVLNLDGGIWIISWHSILLYLFKFVAYSMVLTDTIGISISIKEAFLQCHCYNIGHTLYNECINIDLTALMHFHHHLYMDRKAEEHNPSDRTNAVLVRIREHVYFFIYIFIKQCWLIYAALYGN